MIELQHVSKRYPNGYLALDDVSLHIQPASSSFSPDTRVPVKAHC